MRYLLILWMCLVAGSGLAQRQYPYGLVPDGLSEYRAAVASDPNKELIDLEKHIPDIVLDIRYATTNNFTGERIYDQAKAYARKPVADALKRVQADLQAEGLGLKIFDAYRPYRATVRFYEVYENTRYVASPYRGSRHNRGCAIDLTLIDRSTGQELEMPTGYDNFTRAAAPTAPVSDPVVRKNRDLLIEAMEKHGFRVNSSEWWHFDFKGWGAYEILDIEFSELE